MPYTCQYTYPSRCRAKLVQYTCIAPAKSDTDILPRNEVSLQSELICNIYHVYDRWFTLVKYLRYDRKEDQTDNRLTNANWAPEGMMQIVFGTQKVV